MAESVLFVDDAPDLLRGLQAMFRGSYDVETVTGGDAGLAAIQKHGAYAVVVSDMRMPGMNGAEFLAQVRAVTPDSTRILLTGHSDVASAIDAVNGGQIFRYLTKPCEKEALAEAIAAGVKENQLLRNERELLEKTLLGSIQLLTDVLGATNPAIFGKSMRITRCVKHIAARLGYAYAWQLEAAAALSQLGCITFPQDLIEQAYVGTKLSPEDQALYDTHPRLTRELLQHIPRMEPIAWMIAQQMVKELPLKAPGMAEPAASAIALGAKILKMVTVFDAYRMRTLTDEEAISRLRSREEEFARHLVDLLAEVEAAKAGMELRRVAIARLDIGMILAEEIWGRNGTLKVAKGQEVTSALRIQLYTLCHAGVVGGQVLALVPV